MNKFLKRNFDIIAVYCTYLIGYLLALDFTRNCQDIGCVGIIIYEFFTVLIAIIFTIITMNI